MPAPLRNDYIQALIRLEEDTEYNRAQERLFQEHFDISDLTNVALRLRGVVDATVRQISGKDFDDTSKKIR